MQLTRPTSARRAFTLVEMLVVIAIIGILMALLIPVLQRAFYSTRNSTIAAEIKDLTSAVEAYKSKHNDYFPDFTHADALAAHITVGYPRANAAQIKNWFVNNASAQNLDPAEALWFWLSQVKKNPRDPVNGQGELDVIYDFKPEQLGDRDNDGWKEYYPAGSTDSPYVYFDGRVVNGAYAYTTALYPETSGAQGSTPIGRVRPYRSVNAIDSRDNNRTQPNAAPNNTQWMEPGKFQIICAGQNQLFGVDNMNGATLVFKQFPTPNYYVNNADKTDDEDNLASFSSGKTMGDSIP